MLEHSQRQVSLFGGSELRIVGRLPIARTMCKYWITAIACAVACVAQAQSPSIAEGSDGDGRAGLARILVGQAVALEHGEGVAQDQVRAAALYCEAARLGDAEAMYSLGWMYANGRGLLRREGYAATLMNMAAQLGHPGATSARRFITATPGEQPECLAPPAVEPPPVKATLRIESRTDTTELSAYVESLPEGKKRVANLVSMLAGQYGIHPRLAMAIAVTESNLEPTARSPRGAQGVMQLMPDTATRFGVGDVSDPGKNIRGGLAYLRWLMSYYRGDVLLVAAAYNAGEGAVDRNGGIPPFMETVGYVRKVLAFFKQSMHPFDATLVQPSPIVSKISRVAVR